MKTKDMNLVFSMHFFSCVLFLRLLSLQLYFVPILSFHLPSIRSTPSPPHLYIFYLKSFGLQHITDLLVFIGIVRGHSIDQMWWLLALCLFPPLPFFPIGIFHLRNAHRIAKNSLDLHARCRSENEQN